jgi:RND family efflux transporter MFP subunit
MRRTAAAVALFLLGLAVLVGLLLSSRSSRTEKTGPALPTARVGPADLQLTLRLTGTLEAVAKHPIVSQADDTNIVWVASDGKLVKSGEVILRLSPAEFEKKVSQLKTQVADAEEAIRAAEAEGQKKLQNARAGLTKAEETLRLARAENKAELETAQAEIAFREKEVEVAKAELDKRRQLGKERLLALRDVEAAEDDFRQSQFELEMARQAAKQAEADEAIEEHLRQTDAEKAKLELAQAEISLARSVLKAKRDLEAKQELLAEAELQLTATTVTAPAQGLLLLDRNWEGETLQVGDQIYYEGQRIADIIDTAEMRVRCDIGEAEIERVKVGQKANVLVSAVPGARLRGVVKAIDNLAREKSWWEGGVPGQKMFAALIQLQDRESRLRPGMSATVEIELDKVKSKLAVPVEALFELEGKQLVYQAEGGRYRPVPVKVGARNEMLAAVKGKLRPGDRVACQRPPDRLLLPAESSG